MGSLGLLRFFKHTVNIADSLLFSCRHHFRKRGGKTGKIHTPLRTFYFTCARGGVLNHPRTANSDYLEQFENREDDPLFESVQRNGYAVHLKRIESRESLQKHEKRSRDAPDIPSKRDPDGGSSFHIGGCRDQKNVRIQ